MGYYTDFKGEISLSSSYKKRLLKYLVDNKVAPFEDGEEQVLDFFENSNVVYISGEWKNFHKSIEKLIFKILCVDDEAEGNISCKGEEPMDMWEIDVINGKMRISEAKIEYITSESDWQDKDIWKTAEIILSDANLKDKILLEEL